MHNKELMITKMLENMYASKNIGEAAQRST